MTLTLIFDLDLKFYFCNFVPDSAHMPCYFDQEYDKIEVTGREKCVPQIRKTWPSRPDPQIFDLRRFPKVRGQGSSVINHWKGN